MRLTTAPLSFLPVAMLLALSTTSWAAGPPPPPPGPNPDRAAVSAPGVLAEADRRLWRTAFQLAGRGAHDAALASSGLATDRRLDPVLEWLRLRDREVMAPAADYDRFLADHPDFPALATIAQRREAAELDRVSDDAALEGLFQSSAPLTTEGKVLWALLLKARGEGGTAKILARQVWRDATPDAELEEDLYTAFAAGFTDDDHRTRLDRLLRAKNLGPALRMKGRVTADLWKLAAARIALRRRSGGVDAAVRAVPRSLQDDPGLLLERIRFRRRRGDNAGAQDLLLASGAFDGAHRDTWVERRIQIRNLIKAGEPEKAYRVARDHGRSSGASFAQGEFEAGWLALRFLNQPKQGLAHFQTLFNNVGYPVSLARGAYWTARAYAVLGQDKAAQTWFAEAAAHQQTYYGQLAMHELGQNRLVLKQPPKPQDAVLQPFLNSKLAAVVVRLSEIGQRQRARYFLTHLIKSSERGDIYSLAAELTRRMDSPMAQVTVGKLAALQKLLIPDVAYPVSDAVTGQGFIQPELAHAITRQESAFDQHAISRAGARGLMQLMPATARKVAGDLHLAYARYRLTQEPGYNARLGGAYLAEQLQRFGGYAPVAAAAYNAGPHRPEKWIPEYGDPRSGVVDPVDWMETIPFTETRNYVQRIMEALQIYRIRISGAESGTLTLAADIGLKGTYLCGGRSGKPC